MYYYTYGAILISLVGLLSYLNHRFIRVQPTIAILAAALVISLLLQIIGHFYFLFSQQHLFAWITALHFHDLVINLILGLLLFSGSMTINLSHLKEHKIEVALLTIISTIASAFIIAGFAYFILNNLGFPISFIYCFLFGSLISPTDPIAVLAMFKKMHAPRTLQTLVSVESLFNDGVGVVLFMTALSVVLSHNIPTTQSVLMLFFQETVGGILYGLLLGFITYHLLKPIHDHGIEIILTLSLVIGGYTLAQMLNISGPLAMVVMGIFLNNYRGAHAKAHHELKHFWDLIDELVNILLFFLLGLQLLVVKWSLFSIMVTLCMIVLILITRYVTVAIPFAIAKPWRNDLPYAVSILTWGGLRGGLAVALALALPANAMSHLILTMTFGVVIFSILIQGHTMKYLVKLAIKSG